MRNMGIRQRLFAKRKTGAGPEAAALIGILFLAAACSHSPEIRPGPLTGFSEKVTGLATATARSQLRDHPLKQRLLKEQLPSLEKAATLNQLTDQLKGIEPFKELAYLLETDILFELQKPEHQREKRNFHSPEIQNQVVSAVLNGIKQALVQLRGGENGQ